VSEILIINVSRIGDTLIATPAIRALAAAHPRARVTCLAHPKRMEVLRHLPFVHRVGAVTKNRARLQGWIGGKRYDLAVVHGFDQPLVAYALRVSKRVVAFRQGDPALDRRLQPAVEPPGFQSRHSVHLQLDLVRALGVSPSGLALSYQVTGQEAIWARDQLGSHVPADAAPLIGIQVASFPTKGYRDWPIEHFFELCKRIAERHPRVHFLVFGGALERSRTQWLNDRLAPRSSHFAGKLTLRRTAALMSRLDLYIGVDTGPTHIMGTMGIPMVVLYHCFSPSRLIAPLEHPCLYAIDHPRLGGECSPSSPMSEISVNAVWERVAAALDSIRSGGPAAAAAL